MSVIFQPGLFSLNLHARLTHAANDGLLTPKQLGFVVLSNLSLDCIRPWGPHHFGPGAFAEGAGCLRAEWDVIDSLENRFSYIALDSFGRLLHGVQDFYMHSNWVEFYRQAAVIPVWDGTEAGMPRGIEGGIRLTGAQGLNTVETGPHAGSLLYQLAYDTALRATRRQFTRLAAGAGAGISWLPPLRQPAGVNRIL